MNLACPRGTSPPPASKRRFKATRPWTRRRQNCCRNAPCFVTWLRASRIASGRSGGGWNFITWPLPPDNGSFLPPRPARGTILDGRLKNSLPPPRYCRPCPSWPLFLALLKRAEVFVSGHTGPLHFAAGLGVPTMRCLAQVSPRGGRRSARAIAFLDGELVSCGPGTSVVKARIIAWRRSRRNRFGPSCKTFQRRDDNGRILRACCPKWNGARVSHPQQPDANERTKFHGFWSCRMCCG